MIYIDYTLELSIANNETQLFSRLPKEPGKDVNADK
jgi:hypothetical protein